MSQIHPTVGTCVHFLEKTQVQAWFKWGFLDDILACRSLNSAHDAQGAVRGKNIIIYLHDTMKHRAELPVYWQMNQSRNQYSYASVVPRLGQINLTKRWN